MADVMVNKVNLFRTTENLFHHRNNDLFHEMPKYLALSVVSEQSNLLCFPEACVLFGDQIHIFK